MQIDEQFFQDIGFGNASEEERIAVINKATKIIESRILLNLTDNLTESQMEKFDELAESQGDEAALTYIAAVYPGYQGMVQGEIEKFKDEIIKNTRAE